MNMLQWQTFCSEYFAGTKKDITQQYKNLSIYKDNIEAVHINALKISFPIVRELLGDRFFIKLARDYIFNTQWRSHSIDDLGCNLDQFILNHKLTQNLSYLSEVASIEWLIQSLAEKQQSNIDLGLQLKELFENGEEFTVGLLPHINVFESSRGGMTIWLEHQKESFDSIDITDIKTSYWLFENNCIDVKVKQIDKDYFSFVKAIVKEKHIGALCDELGNGNVIQDLIPLIQGNHILLTSMQGKKKDKNTNQTPIV
jgi:hypothetical protein